MPIDTSIYSQIQAPKINDPMEQYAKIQQLQGVQNQSRLADLMYSEKQREVADDMQVRDLTRQSGGDQTKLRDLLYSGGNYKQGMAIDKAISEQRKATVDIDEKQFKLASERHSIYQKSLGALAQEPGLSKDMVLQVGMGLVQQGILPAALFEKTSASLPDDPVQLRARITQGLKSQMTPEQIFTVFAPKPEKIDNGQQIGFRDTNPNSPTYGQATGGVPVQKLQSPDSVASTASAAAGRAQSERHFQAGQNAPQKPPPGYRATANGGLEAIPGGPADLKINAAGVAKTSDAKDVLGLLDEVDKILPKATGGALGTGVDAVLGAANMTTKGASATSQLKAIEGALISKMPKMSGPQSDKDVLLYRQMAGEVGNSMLPIAKRQAAADMVRTLNEKYAGMAEGTSKNPAPDTPSASKLSATEQAELDQLRARFKK